MRFEQTSGSSYFYKPVLDASDAQNGEGYYVHLPEDTTSEKDVIGMSNWTSCTGGVVVGLSLTSKPSASVTMTLWIGKVAPLGGEPRVEGVLDGVYDVARTSVEDTAPWIGEQYEDYVRLSSIDNTHQLSWDESSYLEVRYIRVCGLDDYYDDDNSEYYIYGNMSSADPLYDSMLEDGASNDFAMVLHNADDDEALVEVFADRDRCSEAVEHEDITLTYRVNSKPKSTVLLDFTSSFPTEAMATPARVSVTAANWMYNNTVTVSSIDDFVDDGNQLFKLSVSVLVSEDVEYSALDDIEFEFVSEDDPSDSESLSTSGLYVYLAEDSNAFTTEAGGETTVYLTLTSLPTVS